MSFTKMFFLCVSILVLLGSIWIVFDSSRQESDNSRQQTTHAKHQEVVPFNQQHHPELQENEVWITNADAKSFENIGWKTKRRGNVALNADGEPITFRQWPGVFPVFAQKSELEKAGVLNLFKD